jgi:hypothetical protein
MPAHLLYSTNVFLKLLIQQQYRGDVHYVWCAESFDATSHPRYSLSSRLAPSSNPIDIYRDLKVAVQRNDKHNFKINEQKVSFKRLAIEWEITGEISANARDEIIYMADNATFDDWRPLVYVIPRPLDVARLQIVPPARRASFAPEYIIADLKRDEFDIIEL